MPRLLQAYLNKQALEHNLAKVKQCAPNSLVLAMIKANAYGHGILNISKALGNVDAFGVACLEEALQIRNAGSSKRIVLLEGFFASDELHEIQKHNLEPVIHNWQQVQEINNYGNLKVNIWLKINTGMHRLGFSIDDFDKVYRELNTNPNLNITVIMTHFSHADQLDSPKTIQQINDFMQCIKNCPKNMQLSMANSSAIIQWPDSHSDWVRPGLMLYGASPISGKTASDLGLLPVMTLQTQIIAIHKVKQGESIGYSGTYVCPDDMTVAVIAIGYGDGYPMRTPSGTPVLVNQKRARIVGKVAMDMANIDVSHIPSAKIGDKVTLWGDGLPVEEVASHMGTLAYELLTVLSSSRIERVLV